MESKRIYLSPPHLTEKELEKVQEALVNNWVAPAGPQLTSFENTLSQYLHQSSVVALNSGTSAIHLALKLIGVNRNDEVICPTFTFVATINPVLYQQATPILVDSEPGTWNMCPEQLERAIQERIKVYQKPKAIIIVHLYGQPARMTAILDIATRYDIPVIEDAAEALGSSYRGRKAGTLTNWGILSFNGNKIITTSAGGALITQNKADAEKALFWATQSKEATPYYQHLEVGYNYRLSNILASIGIGQMADLETKVMRRRQIFDYYSKHLPAGVIDFQPELSGTFSNRWLSCIQIDTTQTTVSPEQLRLALEAENIESRRLWKPMHLQPLFQDVAYYGEGIAEDLFKTGLCLPSGSALKEKELDCIIQVIKNTL